MGTVRGRDAELATLRAAFSHERRPLDVVIRGEAGIGKTSLWQGAVELLRGEGRRVLVTRPTEAETGLPYAALGDLVAAAVGEEELALLSEPQRTALEVALLRRQAEPISDLAVATATLRLIEHLADAGPLVLALDDAQWIDPATARTLAFVLRRLERSDVTVLSTVRSPLSSTVGHDHGGERIEVHLEGMDIDGLAAVVEDHLERRLLLPALVQLRRLSEGNPLAALEIVRVAESRGVELTTGSAAPVPEQLDALLRQRVLALDDPVRELLVVAACAAAPDTELLEHALPGIPVAALLRDAERAAAIRMEASGVVRFSHPLLSHVVVEMSTPPELRDAHARLAVAVTEHVDRARHLAAAHVAPDDDVARDVTRGAARAVELAAPAAAAALFEEAVRLTPPTSPQELAARAEEGARCWIAAADLDRAIAIAEAAIDRLPASHGRGRVRHVLAEARCLRDGATDAFVLWDQALEEVRGDDEATAIVLRTVAWERTVAGDLRGGVRLIEDAIRAAERSGDRERLGATLGMAAMLQFLRGDPATTGTLERAVAALGGPGTSPAHRELERDRAMMAVWGDHPEAAHLVEDRVAAAEGRGDVDEAGYWRWFRSLLLLRSGQLEQAVARALENERDYRRAAPGADTSSDLWLRATIEAQLGRVDDARSRAEAAITTAKGEGMLAFELWAEGTLGFLDLSLGRHDEAADRLWALELRCEELGFDEPGHLRHLADAVEALVQAGRSVEADRLAGRLEAIAGRTGDRWAGGAALRCRAMLREADGARDEARRLLVEARDRHEQLGQPFELARTLLALGATLRRAKRKAEAREALGAAAELFASLPAPLLRARADDELARVGGAGGPRWELTPTERRIAELVAGGRTNREVADELFVTAKTVEWNLSKVYRKVGVRSRSELARSWSQLVAGPE